MSTETKRRVVFSVLCVFALWPLAHRGLVARYDLDPWRFFGWAMYCQPKLPLRVGIDAWRAGVRLSVPETAALANERRRYLARRAVWGSLLPPDDLAQEVLDQAAADDVRIEVRRLVLDPATSRIVTREQVYRYEQ
jgi:hypothetical protein